MMVRRSPLDVFLSWWGALGGFVVLGAMIGAGVHAIQTKQDTRAAVGWVGLIWFAPVVGVILYFLFGINRIQRRAKRTLAESPHVQAPHARPEATADELREVLGSDHAHLRDLKGLMDDLTALPLVAGNRVEPLVGGDEAYSAMLEAIRRAERSITLATYIFDASGVGERFRDALVAAHDRGVDVRVIVDDVGARYSNPPVTRPLREAGVPVGRFMRSVWPWRFRYYNLRNHRKIMVVDGRTGFTGGMNIRRAFTTSEGVQPPLDLHFRLTGPVVAHLQWVFAEDWIFQTGEKLSGDGWFPKLEAVGEVPARGVAHGPDDDFETLRWTMKGALACAEESVSVLTPYFLPDGELMSALSTAAMRGVDVQVLLPARSNLRMVDWASRPLLEPLLERGVSISMGPAPFDHSKLLVVDGAWCLVGSTNWDPRSLSLNFEFNVECYGKTLAGSLDELFQSRLDRAETLTADELRSRGALKRFRDRVVRLFSPYL